MDLIQFLDRNYGWLVLIAAGLGLLLLPLGITVWLRHARRRNTIPGWRAALPALGSAVVLLVVAAVMYIVRPVPVKRIFFRDLTAGQSELETLARADLTANDRRVGPVGEWPQWRGFHRDGRSSETGLLTAWEKGEPRELWRKPLGGGYGSMAVSQNRLYVQDKDGDHERVLCFDATTGAELWAHRYLVDYSVLKLGYAPGPRATPTVHDGRVYTVGGTGVFLCLEAAPAGGQAKVVWEKNLPKQFSAPFPRWGFAGSPLIEGDLVIVQPGGKDGSVAAFHRVSGELIWKSDLDDGPGYSSPMATTTGAARQIIAFTGESLVGLRAHDGQQLWVFDWPTEWDANVATPIIAGEYVFISSAYDGGCALLRMVPAGDGVRAEEIFVRRNKLMRNHFASCVLHDGHLYGWDGTRGGVGTLRCIDLRTFEEKWAVTRQEERRLNWGSYIFADGHLFILMEDGWLICIEATSEGYRKKGERRVVDNREIWALPVLANGRLYIRDGEKLVCVDLKK